MERELNEINVIPLVDVMLVLLVIVLTTATFITTGQIPVDLAKAKESGATKEAPLVITLTAEGEIFLNDQAMARPDLILALQSHAKDSLILVRADRVIILERFVEVVDEVKGLGFDQISLEVVRL
ncbi:MAG: biopolymer transporter ExbD [Nitrospira sp.]|nr:biopolymer transporter ExbD [Nitrospira sp.]HNP29999.1 biopolymer transporter ExbD [Nitrospirales bacterium]